MFDLITAEMKTMAAKSIADDTKIEICKQGYNDLQEKHKAEESRLKEVNMKTLDDMHTQIKELNVSNGEQMNIMKTQVEQNKKELNKKIIELAQSAHRVETQQNDVSDVSKRAAELESKLKEVNKDLKHVHNTLATKEQEMQEMKTAYTDRLVKTQHENEELTIKLHEYQNGTEVGPPTVSATRTLRGMILSSLPVDMTMKDNVTSDEIIEKVLISICEMGRESDEMGRESDEMNK